MQRASRHASVEDRGGTYTWPMGVRAAAGIVVIALLAGFSGFDFGKSEAGQAAPRQSTGATDRIAPAERAGLFAPRLSGPAADIAGRIVPAIFTPITHVQATRQSDVLARARLSAWWDMLVNPKYRKLPELQKLAMVNAFVNQTRLVSDLQHWGMKNYWATPLEFLATDGGDCKAYSVAKYFTLRALGVPDEKLRIIYVKALAQHNEAHMVLAYYPGPESEPLVLDNISGSILPASERADLLPVYSFRGSDLWLIKERGQGHYASGTDSIGEWRELLSRLRSFSISWL